MMDEETNKNNQLFRRARLKGLWFHIDDFDRVVTNLNRMGDAREATAEEIGMWRVLFPNPIEGMSFIKNGSPLEEKTLDISVDEIRHCITGRGVYYLCALDFASLRLWENRAFVPFTDQKLLKTGLYGSYGPDGASIFVKRRIPKGYYIKAEQPIEDIDKKDEWEIESMLEMFRV